jgi:predicted phosphodiesterase
MKLQVVSDLHIEYNNFRQDPLSFIDPSADILVMAGDIGSLYKYDQLKEFIEKISMYFNYVIYVPGNWEYYTISGYEPLSMNNLMYKLHNLSKNIKNLHILDHSSILFDNNICIAGCTLWSNLKIELPKYIIRIHKINSEIYENMYQKSVKYIEKITKYCQDKKYKLILITHHCPTYDVLKTSTRIKKYYSLYASDLDHLLKKELVNTWICGHTHNNFDFITEGGTRVVSNQKGKVKDNVDNYKKDFIIEC